MQNFQNLLNFKNAQLSQGKVWYVFYYEMNPLTLRLERKRIRLNHIKSIPERKKYAKELIQRINKHLAEQDQTIDENSRMNKKLSIVMDLFFKSKQRELRPDSLRSYKSYIKTMNSFLINEKKSEITSGTFAKMDAIEFMEWVYNEKQVSSKTYNNYRVFFSTMFNWMKEHGYIIENPFRLIKKKTDTQKTRSSVDNDVRKVIKDYLEETDYNFLIISLLVFHTLLRPKEIANLKPKNFQLKNQVIEIPASVSKNRKQRMATIPNELMKYLVSWDFNQKKNDEYIFSYEGSPTSPQANKPIDPRIFSKKWVKVREALNLDVSVKLYSLRDSGIIQMLQDGISPKDVMHQADHSNLDTTTIYIKHANPKASEQIKNKSSEF